MHALPQVLYLPGTPAGVSDSVSRQKSDGQKLSTRALDCDLDCRAFAAVPAGSAIAGDHRLFEFELAVCTTAVHG